MSPLTPPYWGEPTASVDWCEANYVHSAYIAEWYNSLSSLAIVCVGPGAWLAHRRILEWRYSFAFALIGVVGLGSFAFHATLQSEHQMLDELPMLYSALLMVFILVAGPSGQSRSPGLPAALVAHALLVTGLTAFTRGALQFYLFQLSFGSLEFFCLYRIWRLSRDSAAGELKLLFRRSLLAYGAAIVLWFIDLKFCGWLTGALPQLGLANPQLHAVWHVLVSAGLYGLLVVVACDHLSKRGVGARLAWFGGVLPYVHVPR